MEEAARPIKIAQVYGINSAGQPVLLKLNDDGTLVQGTGGALVEGMAQRVDEFVQIVGLNSSGHPILLKLNDDGTVSGGGGSGLTAAQLAAIQGANTPSGANPFVTESALPIKHIVFPFAYNTSGLLAGTTVVYTPTIGDQLFGAWFDVSQVWNGTTPKADIGLFTTGKTGFAAGTYFRFGATGYQATLDVIDSDPGTLGVISSMGGNSIWYSQGSTFLFNTVNPLCLVVSRTGAVGGADPGATQGQAELHLLILAA